MRRPWILVRLVCRFLYELVLANLSVARIVLSPSLPIRPGIIAYETKLKSDLALTSLANMITLTPGTLTLDISEDRRVLYIHTLNIQDPVEVAESIRHSFERILLELEP